MKTSKLLLTSLLAAAAMSATAFATDQAYTANEEISSDLTVDGKISVNSGATVTQSAGTVSATRLVLNDSDAKAASFYILTGGVLNITGTEKTGGVTNDTYTTTNAVLIGHWPNGTSKLTVSGGTLNVTEGFTVISWDSAGTLEVSGGTANLYGVSLNTFRGNAANVTLSSGRLNLGAGGLTYGNGTYGRTNKTVTLSGGTLGALADWSSDVAMNITGDVTIDTTKQVVGDDGTSAASSDNAGATISLSGNITASASGTLTVSGTGTLDLSGATLTLSSAITNNATVAISANTVFNLTTSGSAVTLINGGVISGVAWNTLALSNFTYNGETLGGRSSVDVATTAGAVTLTYGAKKTLTWNGDDFGAGTWETATVGTEPTNKPWKDGDTDEAFYSGDSVIFDKNATVSIASGGVSATTMEVRSGTVTLSGGKVMAENGVTVSGGTLKISSKSNVGGNVLVSAGGTFDVNGSTAEIGDNIGTITLAGGTLVNSGSTVGDTLKQIYTLALTANSEIGGTGNFGLIGAGYAATTLTLGGNTLTKTGANTLFLSATRVDAGKIKVEEGVVDLGSGKTNSGSTSFKASIEIGGVSDGNGGYKTATFQGGFTDQYANDGNARTIAVNGGGELQLGTNSNGIRWEIVSSTKISLSNGGVISGIGDAYGALDFNGANTVTATGMGNTISAAVRLRSGAVTFNVAENSDLTISGTLQKPASETISGTLSKSGSGKLVLSGDNSNYGRAINVTEGTLVAAHAKALGTGTVTVSDGATLGIKVASAVTAGTVTFNEGAKFLIDLTDVSVADGTALTIISSSAISFNSTETGSLTSDIIESYFDAGNSVLGSYSSYLREWSYNTTNGLQLTLTIPEPSVFGLLAGLGALALAGSRRRRKKA
ncbi:MAG: beta strand repeat-containing protein [Candidatus Spyradosoma sp.]